MNLFNLMATLGLDSSAYEKGLDDAEGKANTFGGRLKSGLTTAAKVGAAAIGAATTAAVGFGTASVKTGEDFDKAMSQVVATMGYTVEELNDGTSNASKTMDQLRGFAQDMGATTVFSATQAAEALNYMALAGYDAETSMRMLPNVLNLAASGGIDLAYASDMVTDAQTALGISLDETSALVDQMARTASTSNTSVAQLGEAILTIGGTAQFMAGGTDRLNTVLGILADNGIKGSEAGTHLRNMLLKLSAPTSDGAMVMEELGLQIYDAEGNMRDMQDIMQDLGNAMSDLTDEEKVTALSQLFNTRDVAAAQALLGTTVERWEELGGAIVDAEGAAQAMADVQLDNLSGDITLFQSALEGAKIAVSDELTPAIRDFVQFGSLSISTLTEALRIDGLDGVMNALGGILSEAINLIVDKLPEAVNLGITLLQALITGIIDNLPKISDAVIQIINIIGSELINNAPTLIMSMGQAMGQVALKLTDPDTLSQFINGIMVLVSTIADTFLSNQGQIINNIGQILNNIVVFVIENLPEFIQSGFEIIMSLANGIVSNLPTISKSIGDVIGRILTTIVENLPKLFVQGVDILLQLALGLVGAIPQLIASIPEIIRAIIDTFAHADWADIGKNIMNGIKDGIVNMVSNLVESAKNAAKNIVSGVKGFLGIESPSKVFRDQVGKMIGEGLSEGIDESAREAVDSAENMAKEVLGTMDGMDAKLSTSVNAVNASMEENGLMSENFGGIIDVEKEPNGLLNNINNLLNRLVDCFGHDSGDIIIPVYIGNQQIDELIVNAKRRVTMRSGGYDAV